MKPFVILIMLTALWLLYRIAYPKREPTASEALKKRPIDPSEVVVKSRFVRPSVCQPQPTPATPPKTDSAGENSDTFAARNTETDPTDDEPDPSELDIEPDENELPPNTEEDAEELRRILGEDAGLADGLSIEQMDEGMEATRNPTDDKAAILYRVEKTDMFEKLVAGDVVKAALITAIVDRHVRNMCPEETGDDEEQVDFDVDDFLS
ncbi:MAG: hypothetical protein LBR57_04445 [Alistipes sp.]|jgi:hypothetical protein|nr:hypothetical protein [Alistipes sp.]